MRAKARTRRPLPAISRRRYKLAAGFLALSLLLTAAHGYVQYRAERLHLRELFLAEPMVAGGGGIDQKAVAELTEQGMLITYELAGPSTVECLNSSYPVLTVGTNASYIDVTGYPLLSGGFLTETAIKDKSRLAVLNEKAAHRLFGTVDIGGNTIKVDGELWTAVGVIQDGDEENSRVYIPATLAPDNPTAFLARMGGGHSEGYVRTKLGELGVHENSYRIVNLSRSASAFGERLAVSLLVGVLCLLAAAIKGLVGAVGVEIRAHRREKRSGYMEEPLAQSRHSLGRLAGILLLLLAAVAAALVIALRILEPCLGWREAYTGLSKLSGNDYGGMVDDLRRWQTASILLFCTTLLTNICLYFSLSTGKHLCYTNPQ